MAHMAHDLFLLMLHLCHIKNENTLISVFLDAMNSCALGIQFRYSDQQAGETQWAIPLATTQFHFGTIRLEGDLTHLNSDQQVIVRNAVRMLAMILENHQQARLLEDEKLCLEELVRERTEVLKASEEKYRQIVETAQEGIWIIDDQGTTTFANQRMAEMLGLTVGEMMGRSLYDFIDSEGRNLARAHIQGREEGLYDTQEFKFLHRDGSEVWALISTTPLRGDGGETLGTMIMVTDITARKHAQGKLLEYQKRLQSLATQLSLAEEHERRRIATSLHDSACQDLALIKMKLKTQMAVLPSSATESMEEVCSSIESVIQDLRAMTFDLSPPTLYLCGLEAAGEKLLEQELRNKQGIQVDFDVRDGYLPLTDEVRILLYQSIRELVINIVKHAQASRVTVSIRPQNGNIQIVIRDNGIGFDPQQVEQTVSSSGGFGLFNIAERLRSIGGAFDVESRPGHGACFTLIAGLKTQNSAMTAGP